MDKELGNETGSSPGSIVDSTVNSIANSTTNSVAETTTQHEPVRTPANDPQRRASSASSGSRSLARTRSQNGYGVADETDELDDIEAAAIREQTGQAEKDPFEVGWDGGDSDPLCPRSFSKARKWIITMIVAMVGFCL